jgi:hypothetical protein
MHSRFERVVSKYAWRLTGLVAVQLAAFGGIAGCRMTTREMEAAAYAGPVTPWPRPVPVRVKPEARDDLFITTLGQVETPLADGTFDPVEDRVTLRDGSIIRDYYKEHLEVPFYRPIDKSVHSLPPSGWCSWYYYYQEINSEEVLANARWIAEHLAPYGARYVQVDDGWQGIGRGLGENRDWTTIDERFRWMGMDGLAAGIRDLGLEAGLWLAPHGQSNLQVAKESAAFLWKEDGTTASDTWEGTYLIDPSIPEAHRYLHELFTRLREWGYTYFKIDGQPIVLDEYAGKAEFMRGEVDQTLSPEDRAPQLYRSTLKTIREAIGDDSYLLGCWGIPLPGIGIMNGSRTAGDVVQSWGGFLTAADAVQKWNFLHNITWYCDPDVFMVRPPLTEGMARAWATLQGLSGQALLTSDRLTDLPPSRVEMLKRIYPAVDVRPLDLFRPDRLRKPIWDLKVRHVLPRPDTADPSTGSYERAYDVVGVFNYDDHRAKTYHVCWEELGLDSDAAYHVYDFWQKTYLGAWERGVFLEVPPADVRVVTIVPADPVPVLVSTSRHITQGWVDLLELGEGTTSATPVLKGRSIVIGGDPYTLTIGLPRSEPSLELVGVKARGGFARPPRVRFASHQGYATVTFESDSTQEVKWALSFEPADHYVYPVSNPFGLKVSSTGLTDAEVTWQAAYASNAGHEIAVDGQVLGVAFAPRAILRDLIPGQKYTIGVRALWADGSGPEEFAEVEYSPEIPDVVYLSDLDPERHRQDWGDLGCDTSVQGNPLRVGGEEFERGLGTHAESRIAYRLLGMFSRFEALVGLDDEAEAPPENTVVFQVWGDDVLLWESEPLQSQQAPVPVELDVSGVELLELRVLAPGEGIDYTHADWLEARVLTQSVP